MHYESNKSMLAAVATGLGIIGLVSVPAASSLALQLSRPEPKKETYEDEDGKASPESMKAYSAKLPKFFIVLFASLGSGTTIATAVLSTLSSGKDDGLFLENWLSAGASVSRLIMTTCLPRERERDQNQLTKTTDFTPVSGYCHCLEPEFCSSLQSRPELFSVQSHSRNNIVGPGHSSLRAACEEPPRAFYVANRPGGLVRGSGRGQLVHSSEARPLRLRWPSC